MIGGQATRTWISLAPPRSRIMVQQRLQRRAADDGILHQQHALAFQHLAQRRVLQLHAVGAVVPLDERPADVAIAHQPFDGGHAQLVGHGVGGGLAGVGHRHDDRVVVERHHGRADVPGSASSLPRAARDR